MLKQYFYVCKYTKAGSLFKLISMQAPDKFFFLFLFLFFQKRFSNICKCDIV